MLGASEQGFALDRWVPLIVAPAYDPSSNPAITPTTIGIAHLMVRLNVLPPDVAGVSARGTLLVSQGRGGVMAPGAGPTVGGNTLPVGMGSAGGAFGMEQATTVYPGPSFTKAGLPADAFAGGGAGSGVGYDIPTSSVLPPDRYSSAGGPAMVGYPQVS